MQSILPASSGPAVFSTRRSGRIPHRSLATYPCVLAWLATRPSFCVVQIGANSGDTPEDPLYRFLRDELHAKFIQFIPCVEPKSFERTAPGYYSESELVSIESPRARPGHPMSIVTEWTVDPDDWGGFLAAIFDEWLAHDRARVKVNLFETMLDQLAGRPAGLCTQSPICGKNVALENDGRVYSCDHFVYPEYELGRVGDKTFAELVFSLRQLEFGLDKFNKLPTECRKCPYLKLCWGECPRTRLFKTRPGEGNLSYLCSGWKRFYAHAVPLAPRRPIGDPKLVPAVALVRPRPAT